jgi:hypothetical protein
MNIPLTQVAGPYVPEGEEEQMTELPWEVADDQGTHTFPVSKRGTLLLARNVGASGDAELTVLSSANRFGRKADAVIEIPPGETFARVFVRDGWENATGSGLVSFTSSSASLEVVAIAL